MFTLPKTSQEYIDMTTKMFGGIPKTAGETKELLSKVQAVVTTEAKNASDMMKVYAKAATGDASPNDIASANKAALELAKATRFAALTLVPGAVFMLPALVKAAKDYNIDLVPATVSAQFDL